MLLTIFISVSQDAFDSHWIINAGLNYNLNKIDFDFWQRLLNDYVAKQVNLKN